MRLVSLQLVCEGVKALGRDHARSSSDFAALDLQLRISFLGCEFAKATRELRCVALREFWILDGWMDGWTDGHPDLLSLASSRDHPLMKMTPVSTPSSSSRVFGNLALKVDHSAEADPRGELKSQLNLCSFRYL